MKNRLNHNRPKNYTIVLFQPDSNYHKRIDRLETKSPRRFLRRLKLLNSQISCYLRVSYTGGGFNDGNYDNRKDLMLAFKAFCER